MKKSADASWKTDNGTPSWHGGMKEQLRCLEAFRVMESVYQRQFGERENALS